jgi:hypothetical protein
MTDQEDNFELVGQFLVDRTQVLGKGSFGEVVKALRINKNYQVSACKVIMKVSQNAEQLQY